MNDPYPTAFPNGGFDLDAVGVIHSLINSIPEENHELVRVYPNPFTENFMINSDIIIDYKLFNSLGEVIISARTNQHQTIVNISDQPNGIYFLQLNSEQKSKTIKLIKE